MDADIQRVREFQEAYKEDFGEEISEAEASDMLNRLVELFRVIARPLPPKNPEKNS